ncbi:hypothetical protein BDN72DRAFT_774790 [Pluteus cervinus]|uniref:Uncharacterized protein n=1 Tax=Pluteus cervinus TaxID=181527 RepID=A0ACD3AE92_9AGAR|nr:hypothetical protein BDN72DRAFT_774790 [Pluteus cervinus]
MYVTTWLYIDCICDSQLNFVPVVRSSDADVTFQSIDKVRFHVYKKDLATFSGGFPPAELVSSDLEIIDLPERAVVLDIVFSFTRPQRYPDIHDLKIETLFELAEAAEKYEVYNVIILCKTVIRMKTLTYPLQVLRYASRNGYGDLADDACPLLLGTPLLDIFELRMPERYLGAWVSRLYEQ